jgi:hypothetical protein
MFSSFDPGALLSHSYVLRRGPRVRLRMARLRDEQAIRELLVGRGLDPGDLELGRLVRFDPRRRVAICATALIGSRETVVGFGAIDLDRGPLTEPDMLVVDERLTDGLGELLHAALRGRARAIALARAA